MAATESDGRSAGIAARASDERGTAFSDAAVYTGGIYAAQALLFVAGLTQKRLLGPTATGYWALLGTVFSYLSFAALGVFQGGTREIPAARGRSDYSAAAAFADTAATATIAAIGCAAFAVAAVAIGFGGSWPSDLRWGLVLLAVVAPLNALTDAHELMFQVTRRFPVLAATSILKALLTLIVTTGLVVTLGFYGMVVGWIAMLLAVLVFWMHLGLAGPRTPAFHPRVERRRVGELMRVGIPIQIYAQLWVLFISIDNLLVVHFLGVKQLGYYAVAVSATSYILLLPNSIATALFPRMQEDFGARSDVREIARYVTGVQRLLAWLLAPIVVGGAFYLVPVVVREGLPAFTPAIRVIQIMVAGSFCIAMVHMPIESLLTTGRRWHATIIMLSCVLVNAALNYVAVGVLDWGLKGAAGATALSYAVAFIAVTVSALRKAISPGRLALHLGSLVSAGGWTIGAAWLVETSIGSGTGSLGHDLLFGFVKYALFLIALTPWFALAERHSRAITISLSATVRVGNMLRTTVQRVFPPIG